MTQRNTTPVPRKIPFEFPDDINPQWIPGRNELAAMINGGSLTMPYLEPFLIRTMREAAEQVCDTRVKADADAFNRQEGQHFRAHRRFNDLLKRKRYPQLADVEDQMEASYARLSKRSLRARMAYTAGFEAMTMGVTKWLIGKRIGLFRNADPRVVSFVLWHMVEETEHKTVAHDVYKALYGSSLGAYWARMVGVFHGSLDVIKFSMRGYRSILKQDGVWTNFRARLRLAREMAGFVWNVGPYLFRAALPGHDPRNEPDEPWVLEWLAAYPDSNPDDPPLVDTGHPTMPVPFAPAKTMQAAA
ncbi:metal-dependent hydrolase [bacterium]|nr:metal-dependent hydrolase [bacterium]